MRTLNPLVFAFALLLTACSGAVAATEAPTPSLESASLPAASCTAISASEREDYVASLPYEAVNDTDWQRGSANASVTITEYSDFQCPFCAQLSAVLAELEAKYPDDLRVVYRHFPLIGSTEQPLHDKAAMAMQAAEAAGVQGKFWEMHDALFASQTEWTTLTLDEFEAWLFETAAALELNVDQFSTDLQSNQSEVPTYEIVYEQLSYRYDGGSNLYVLINPIDLSTSSFKDEIKSLVKRIISLKGEGISLEIYDSRDAMDLQYNARTTGQILTTSELDFQAIHLIATFDSELTTNIYPNTLMFFPGAFTDTEIIGKYVEISSFDANTLPDPQAAWEAGQELQLGGTPFVLINGMPYNGPLDLASMEGIVKSEFLVQRQFHLCPEMELEPDAAYTATLHTEKGDIVIELFPDVAPMAVNSFIFLAENDWYDNVSFHRVIPGFVAQSGDPSGTGYGDPGYLFAIEVDPNLVFDRAGLFAMANSGPTSNGSQFFITLGPAEHLNGQFTIFGEVIQGMDVVESLTPRDPSQSADLPIGDLILDVTIEVH